MLPFHGLTSGMPSPCWRGACTSGVLHHRLESWIVWEWTARFFLRSMRAFPRESEKGMWMQTDFASLRLEYLCFDLLYLGKGI